MKGLLKYGWCNRVKKKKLVRPSLSQLKSLRPQSEIEHILPFGLLDQVQSDDKHITFFVLTGCARRYLENNGKGMLSLVGL